MQTESFFSHSPQRHPTRLPTITDNRNVSAHIDPPKIPKANTPAFAYPQIQSKYSSRHDCLNSIACVSFFVVFISIHLLQRARFITKAHHIQTSEDQPYLVVLSSLLETFTAFVRIQQIPHISNYSTSHNSGIR